MTCLVRAIHAITPVRKARRLGMLNIPRNRCQVFVLRLHSAFSSARWMIHRPLSKASKGISRINSASSADEIRTTWDHLGRQNSKKVRQKIRLASHGLVPTGLSVFQDWQEEAKRRAHSGRRSLLKRAFSLVNDSCGQGDSNKN